MSGKLLPKCSRVTHGIGAPTLIFREYSSKDHGSHGQSETALPRAGDAGVLDLRDNQA